jgi:hypothetical protein
MIHPRHAFAPLVVIALGGTLAGCGTKTLNSKQIEQQIITSEQSKAAGYPVTEAHCPSGVEAKAGKTFLCTVKIDGIQVSMKATITSVGDKANITTEPAQPIINAKGEADQIAAAAGAGVTVDCGPPVQQVPIGFILTCKATDGTNTQSVQLKVTDASGTLAPINPAGGSTTTTAPADTTTTAAP